MELLVIIPCYNEEASIERTVESLKNASPGEGMDFIIVNDGSRDNTRGVCADNRYPVIDLPFNLGLANAVQTGMRYAYDNGYKMALQFDGDGQHLPEYIPEMIGAMREAQADIAIGSRYTQESSRSLRGMGGGLLRFIIKLMTGKTITDPTSGMRLFNHKMIEKFAKQMNLGPEPDTIAHLINQKAAVIEVPVKMQERKAGKSYLNALSSVGYMIRMIVSVLIIHRFRGE